jgi:hypothetical protein
LTPKGYIGLIFEDSENYSMQMYGKRSPTREHIRNRDVCFHDQFEGFEAIDMVDGEFLVAITGEGKEGTVPHA